ncbi:MAG: DNA-binding MarR family transcriptional regulator [Saprospiraceae bacterium]|jgi:DNA-binding MarR family transcriptional regulator
MVDGPYQSKLIAFGLKGSMLSILFIIGKQELVSQKFIADILLLDQSTMSRDIKKLVSKD